MPKVLSIKKVVQSNDQTKYALFNSETISEEGSLFSGFRWGILLSVLLWISVFVWENFFYSFS